MDRDTTDGLLDIITRYADLEPHHFADETSMVKFLIEKHGNIESAYIHSISVGNFELFQYLENKLESIIEPDDDIWIDVLKNWYAEVNRSYHICNFRYRRQDDRFDELKTDGLFMAVSLNRINFVKILIDKLFMSEFTAAQVLAISAENNFTEIFNFIYSACASLNKKRIIDGIFEHLCVCKNYHFLENFIAEHKDHTFRIKQYFKSDDANIVRILINAQIMNASNCDTALMAACKKENYNVVRVIVELIQITQNINGDPITKYSPYLSRACEYNQIDVAKYLIQKEHSVDVGSILSHTCRVEILKLLIPIASREDIDGVCMSECTDLHDTKIIKFLLLNKYNEQYQSRYIDNKTDGDESL
jgi:hypothetical protein